ncbi:laminin subunit alpha-like [Ornithodoros turicata]|uniref:laminin subunit alpha-like n=1 Tax=Ornithodoros turicata TaxID=34597 RepID=UPI0031398AC8
MRVANGALASMAFTGVAAAMLLLLSLTETDAQILNPPYFNLAEGRSIWATATCGDSSPDELYCKLVGANLDAQDSPNINLIQGQVCDYCNMSDPRRAHPPENAIDGSEKWWQSPPLSRGTRFNEVNLTIDLGQEFHVAYVFVKMANSPRPGVWVLERSTDNGETYKAWQYFADTYADCTSYFGPNVEDHISKDDSVICETKFSKVVPLEGGEMVISLLNGRPSADNFTYSPELQEWTKATNVRVRLLRTKTLLGHLMSVERQDPTVTRRYFYSIKDINIGGRCVCNGHADTCDVSEPTAPTKLHCRCQHNTCGPQCDQCCPGFQQNKWSRASIDNPHVCEPCNCFGHSHECVYDEEVDAEQQSLNIHGIYDGGGVCQNCRHNTDGINCDKCKPGYFRPYNKLLNATDVCHPCQCDLTFSSGNCAEGSGQCECRPEFLPPHCDQCSVGYYGFPACRPCDCHSEGTRGRVCQVQGGQCPCKPNYDGKNCDRCAEGYYGFPDCQPCHCNPGASVGGNCDAETGQCECRNSYGGRQCLHCEVGFYDYPACKYCSCDTTGTVEDVCNNSTGECLCETGYGGRRCDQCAPGFYGYPNCVPCECDERGSLGTVCDIRGNCRCLNSFTGPRCDKCAPGFYSYPDCFQCDCDPYGSIGRSCDHEGKCVCRPSFEGDKCDQCKKGFYNYPRCEGCNCNPAGIVATFGGCGSLPVGELCECKERVMGRICDQCRPLYWNLKSGNPYGCEECECHTPGTMGGMNVCEGQSGQCHCKPNVGGRQCSECLEGTYELQEGDLFGCQDCGCDVGGSVGTSCDPGTGQCRCRPRVTGRRCDEPLQAHFFPTLHQHRLEVEEGRTPSGVPARFDFDSSLFPGYSWRGYAIFSNIQKEILMDLDIQKPSLFQVIARYVSLNGDNVYANITLTPDTYGETKQSEIMVLSPSRDPRFQAVVGPDGVTALPFVLNPGRWTLSVQVQKPIFMDYVVVLPEAYYEATLLQEDVRKPCSPGSPGPCRLMRYPDPPDSAMVSFVMEDGYYESDGATESISPVVNFPYMEDIGHGSIAEVNSNHPSVAMQVTVPKSGYYVFLVSYHTLDGNTSTTADFEVSEAGRTAYGKLNLPLCNYGFLCQQVVIDDMNRVLEFEFKNNTGDVRFTAADGSEIGVGKIMAIPVEDWHTDYVVPKEECVQRDGECMGALFPSSSPASKVEFESGENADRVTENFPPTLKDNMTRLVFLDLYNPKIEIRGTVPAPGPYVFVVHYYQPEHPSHKLDVKIEDGTSFEGELPLEHCASASGCRAVVRDSQTQGRDFQLNGDFTLRFIQPDEKKSVWLDYVMVIPEDQFDGSIMNPLPLDKAVEFIKQCGQNSFQMNEEASDFCKEAIFSLTTEYNNGALPCRCNVDGSKSFECERFGGQCQCKDDVIGRTCSQCRTGYFGFPNCRPCDCPNTAVCHPITGQCICPPRVTGEKCDTCEPLTFGYTRIIGCEECNCKREGVHGGNMQCDLQTGQCQCKSSIVGRTCDECKRGYWMYPYCRLCNCDLRGTVEDICNQDTSECFCKENVEGESCDQCKPGTFFLEEHNPLGCTKCFCFGTTERCASAHMFRGQVTEMDGWTGVELNIVGDLKEQVSSVYIDASPNFLRATEFPEEPSPGSPFFFSAPFPYLGKKITSYGGTVSYTIVTKTDNDVDFGSILGADVILTGNNLTIAHEHAEQPAAGIPLEISFKLVESEFRQLSGRKVTREQLMMVLVNLEGLYIRGAYFHPALEVRVTNIAMDIALNNYVQNSQQALTVEQCHCPPNYRGSSCEECSSGYYRSKTGPYLGFCVPCQCNGHSDECDVVTGKCLNCRHNTHGDHCDMCAEGYHGDARRGSPDDCLICACPLPIPSNNFAQSCEVSPSGLEISCNCKPGYFGPRCDVCDAGYFGQPDVIGSTCEPCKCSGNIDTNNPQSCDSVTGDCVLCLNNTSGPACELCAPGFYGDAILGKDCRKCPCEKCGTARCDHRAGVCECNPNVVGDLCERCAPNHWGYDSCQGCRDCHCGAASFSDQCDLQTGQCSCKPGAGGQRCEVCEPGYWRYSEEGCVSCNCAAKFSAGAVCNQLTGQCQCLPGVVGDKCDSCPHRWVFVERQGCHECGECIHALLDDTDALGDDLAGIHTEVNTLSASYLANQRLMRINNTAQELRDELDAFDIEPSGISLTPLSDNVAGIEALVSSLQRESSNMELSAQASENKAHSTLKDAIEEEAFVKKIIEDMHAILRTLRDLADGIGLTAPSSIDRVLDQAKHIKTELEERDFTERKNDTQDTLEQAREILERAREFALPADQNNATLHEVKRALEELQSRLEEFGHLSRGVKEEVQRTEEQLRMAHSSPVKGIIAQSQEIEEKIDVTLTEARGLLEGGYEFNNITDRVFGPLQESADRLEAMAELLAEGLKNVTEGVREVKPQANRAQDHSRALQAQARECEHILKDPQELSSSALAYDEIVNMIEKAHMASQAALNSSDEAHSMSDGVVDTVSVSKEQSEDFLEKARELQDHVDNDLKRRMATAHRQLATVRAQNDRSGRDVEYINRELDGLRFGDVNDKIRGSLQSAGETQFSASNTTARVEEFLGRLPGDNVHAKEVSIDSVGVKDSLLAASRFVEKAIEDVPKLNRQADRLSVKDGYNKAAATDVRDKIEELKRKVELAKDEANRIKIGMEFNGDQTVQLRNPENLRDAATFTELSMYFKTAHTDGVLFYLGNEPGSPGRAVRSVGHQDDYMALILRHGYLVLIVNLGDGAEEIRHSKRVADGQWHQVIIDRTGKTVNLIVRTEVGEGVDESKDTRFLQGTHSVFNLDQEHAKFYIGGVPDHSMVQLNLDDRNPFEGSIEELVFGSSPIGLWNFAKREGELASVMERDSLVIVPTSNGLSFDGTGYAIIAKDKNYFRDGVSVSMSFKTFANEGLLVLIHNNAPAHERRFVALELRDGRVLFKFNLGGQLTVIPTRHSYNDGKWHRIDGGTFDNQASLTVGEEGPLSTMYRGEETTLESIDDIFIGGHPKEHGFSNVTRVKFEGCIQDMDFDAFRIDMLKTKEALAVSSGCPPSVARVISFTGDATGYVAMPSSDITQDNQITFKFRTIEPDGLIFYAANDDQSTYLAIGIRDGTLFMRAKPGGEVKTDVTYNDGVWHYVTASSYVTRLRLDIDDAIVRQLNTAEQVYLPTSSKLYFGGVPESYEINPEVGLSHAPFFIGCLGDVTVRGDHQNFAATADRTNVALAKCPTSLERKDDDKMVSPGTGVMLEGGSGSRPSVTLPGCVLPLHPAEDEDLRPDSGIRFGNTPHSRLEYHISTFLIGSLLDESVISMEFRTQHRDGVLFYIGSSNMVDYIAIFMKDGKVHVMFSCGTGPGLIMSSESYNLGDWHSLQFTRRGQAGTLYMDEKPPITGTSQGMTNSLNLHSPAYLGGLPQNLSATAKHIFKGVTSSFPGCIRNLEVQSEELNRVKNRVDVTRCSQKVETGSFFGGNGSRIVLYDNYKVGKQMTLELDVKPRRPSGVLVAVHSNDQKDFVLLQLANGTIKFMVDNGAGIITAAVEAGNLCDGEWHTIKVVKNQNVVTLSAAGQSKVAFGTGGVTATDTANPFYVGGVPDPANTRAVETTDQYVGCIRYLQINSKLQSLAESKVHGDVHLNSCPTI